MVSLHCYLKYFRFSTTVTLSLVLVRRRDDVKGFYFADQIDLSHYLLYPVIECLETFPEICSGNVSSDLGNQSEYSFPEILFSKNNFLLHRIGYSLMSFLGFFSSGANSVFSHFECPFFSILSTT